MKRNKTKTKIIGITGGISTGKSTVSNIIESKGYKVIDADKIAKNVVEKEKPAYKKIVEYFGSSILMDDKSIDRKKLGSIVFKDKDLLKILNNIVHPKVFEIIKKSIESYSESEKCIFVDVPLLVEEIDKFREYKLTFDEIWLVYTDEKTQLDRLMLRGSISKKEALEKIKAQMPIDLKREFATNIIDNRGDLEALKKQVEKMINETT